MILFWDHKGTIVSLYHEVVTFGIVVQLVFIKIALRKQISTMKLSRVKYLLGCRSCDLLKYITVDAIWECCSQRSHKGKIESDLICRFRDDRYHRKCQSFVDQIKYNLHSLDQFGGNRNLIFDERVEELIDAIGHPYPYEAMSDLRVAVILAMHIEIPQELQLLIIHNSIHKLPKNFTILHPILSMYELPHKLKIHTLGTAFSEFPQHMEHI